MNDKEAAFWREAYIAAIRAGVAGSAKQIADNATANYREYLLKREQLRSMQTDSYR